ncbi:MULTISPECIES: pyruvate carboxylase [unclassified Arcicella]|uniref:pyruvate carboxylase n=1 Tax=unclassified Arcicella TaxID=2644986 RepID=UPI0028650F65|nr:MULTISPECIES: pyruvate carboxylase [unclassified Arcicella]MDR6564404.1 pyruvate carboxylase [Arcicella sp. BE51]MDR6814153.1 pyruvate carboxylase [Arcicella sp. BE140]MDR6825465.1 pyruvate carboxylase [Arcicella sp. BE139]
MAQPYVQKINSLLVANRGEIAIRIMRAASELGIRTVAVYTFEDRYSLHRYKADEAYQIGKDDEPLKPYLDIEGIIQLCKEKNVDAIHPGYGFLSENVTLARRCREEGIKFIGPSPEAMDALGDKVAAKVAAKKAQVPMIEDSKEDLINYDIALAEARKIGFPVMVKAAAGGGGRGMRVVREEESLEKAFSEAKNEAKNAFGDDTIFIEKFIDQPKHIEVQLLGDQHGNLVHLYERDCSVQRRFQKVVEVAPSFGLKEETRQKLYQYALSIGKAVNYYNAGTVEFLVDKDENIFFIEVNPRIQVEHTITEEVTGIDIVRTQILIAQNYKLSDSNIFILKQEDIPLNGYAIQCRITTEDPANGFKPDFGTIIAYRNAAGFGIRLDEGSSYPGVKISPYFDSMLVKVSARGRTLKGASERLSRALTEFRIRGVKTNIPFLKNVITHPVFQKGKCVVQFIDSHPELFDFKTSRDRSTKVLRYLGDVVVNGNPDVKVKNERTFRTPVVPAFNPFSEYPAGNKQLLDSMGADKFSQYIKEQKQILYTDTTFRDGHQSLLATRVRTKDMVAVAESYAKNFPQLFSMEVWGGATFDVAMRFLNESPWKRLEAFREAMPNMLLQMLFRGSNAVGYSAYPDNLIEKFVEKSAATGIDVFRIFDSLNWVEAMKVSIKAVRERTNAIAEASICYTGDVFTNEKYSLQYYLDMARQLEDEGAHILAIKDMAGLLRPYQAQLLVTELKKALSIPVHLHTHDTASIQAATYLKAIEAGVDIVDCSLGSMSGLTAQPNFNSIVAMMQGNERECPINLPLLNQYSNYWEDIRQLYYPFESELKAGTAEVYDNEIPGGQYTNLRGQAIALGVGDKFELMKSNYIEANKLFGDIVKVTPSSKVVGDMAIFMTANSLTAEDVYAKGATLSFPESVKDFFKGGLGQPYLGFPKQLQEIILKGEVPLTSRPNDTIPPIDFGKDMEDFKAKFPESEQIELDYLSYKMYPKVYEDYYKAQQIYGEVSLIPTPAFLYGLKPDEEILINIDEGKTIIVKYLYQSEPDESGLRAVTFELNGQARRIKVLDKNIKIERPQHIKATSKGDIGAPLQGRLSRILVKPGDEVKKNAPLYVIEAMKMESIVSSPFEGIVSKVVLNEGTVVEQEDLVLAVEEATLPEPDKEEFLFVYGTLRKDFGNELHKLITRNSEFIGMATYQGKMYNIGEYPGIVPSEDESSKVVGELYKLSNSIRLIRILDEYEEFYPENIAESVFVRKSITVSIDGKDYESYSYLYNRPTDGLAEITSGNFLA